MVKLSYKVMQSRPGFVSGFYSLSYAKNLILMYFLCYIFSCFSGKIIKTLSIIHNNDKYIYTNPLNMSISVRRLIFRIIRLIIDTLFIY